MKIVFNYLQSNGIFYNNIIRGQKAELTFFHLHKWTETNPTGTVWHARWCEASSLICLIYFDATSNELSLHTYFWTIEIFERLKNWATGPRERKNPLPSGRKFPRKFPSGLYQRDSLPAQHRYFWGVRKKPAFQNLTAPPSIFYSYQKRRRWISYSKHEKMS